MCSSDLLPPLSLVQPPRLRFALNALQALLGTDWQAAGRPALAPPAAEAALWDDAVRTAVLGLLRRGIWGRLAPATLLSAALRAAAGPGVQREATLRLQAAGVGDLLQLMSTPELALHVRDLRCPSHRCSFPRTHVLFH